jgi:hypothetical protein
MMRFVAVAAILFAIAEPIHAASHRAARHKHADVDRPWTLNTDVDFFQIKSQSWQDGVLAYVFQNIGVTNRFYVEFGFNAPSFDGGSGANSYVLHNHFGWTGLLLDGDNENAAINLRKVGFITPDNIVDIFKKHDVPREPDYVSIDIDSYDIWLFKALVSGGFRPRVLTIEYNANFPLGANMSCTPESRTHAFDRAFGASLGAFGEVADETGYAIVQVVPGLDVVLVRRDVLSGLPTLPLSHLVPGCGPPARRPCREGSSRACRTWRTGGPTAGTGCP